MKIYTKTGDKGETGVLGGLRVYKNDPLIQAIGDVDELNTSLGVLIALTKKEGITTYTDHLFTAQHTLFVIGANIAQLRTETEFIPPQKEQTIFFLEELIDQLDKELPPLTEFILPGGSEIAAQCFLSRAICRRAERSIVGLITPETSHRIEKNIQYLNRLSDALFTLARWYNTRAQVTETAWVK